MSAGQQNYCFVRQLQTQTADGALPRILTLGVSSDEVDKLDCRHADDLTTVPPK